MAAKTAIEWTATVRADGTSTPGSTWNPIRAAGPNGAAEGWACEKVSPACAHCYAEGLNRLRGNGRPYLPGQHAPPLLDDRALGQPLRWRRPRRVFVCSMTDVAWDAVPDEWIARIWAVMAQTPHHTYLVLTKRPARLADLLTSERFEAEVRWWWDQLVECPRDDLPWGHVFGHVWIGATVENQTWADRRLPHLLRVPAAVRFLSCEPLLGPIDLTGWLSAPVRTAGAALPGGWPEVVLLPVTEPALHWVITGGESGGPPERRLVERCRPASGGTCRAQPAGCRDCHGTGWRLKPRSAEWLRSLRDECQQAGVAYLHKQHGGPTPKAGGRVLDGVVWHEYPDGSGYALPAEEVA